MTPDDLHRRPDEVAPRPGARIAVIGSGISGLSAAWLLSQRYAVDVFEQADWIGGHSHTVEVAAQGGTVPVDTGFIVYNARNYPNLVRLFDHLGVATLATDMSFAVSLDGGRLEYGSDMPRGLFAQPANLLRPRFLAMLRDIVRFYRTAPAALAALESAGAGPSLGEWLAREGYGASFARDHLLPMAAAIWSAPAREMMAFPAASLLRFFHNHGLLQATSRPQWRTVIGGSQAYVKKLTAGFRERIHLGRAIVGVRRTADGVALHTNDGAVLQYDHVVMAAHADQSLALLEDADDEERRQLGAFSYQENRAVLHSDAGLMPRRRAAWASWNYMAERAPGDNSHDEARLSVSYWMNRLQNLPNERSFFVTLNPTREPDPASVHASFVYHHPMFDGKAMSAQGALAGLQGRRNTWFCGSYFGYGFHEDGLVSGLAVAAAFGVPAPWKTEMPVKDVAPALLGGLAAPAVA